MSPFNPKIVQHVSYEQILAQIPLTADSRWFPNYFDVSQSIPDLYPDMVCHSSTRRLLTRRQLVTYKGRESIMVNPLDALQFLRDHAKKDVKYLFLCVDTEGDTLALRANWIDDLRKTSLIDLSAWKLLRPLETSRGYVPAEERPC